MWQLMWHVDGSESWEHKCWHLRRRGEKGKGKGGYGNASGLESCVQKQVPCLNQKSPLELHVYAKEVWHFLGTFCLTWPTVNCQLSFSTHSGHKAPWFWECPLDHVDKTKHTDSEPRLKLRFQMWFCLLNHSVPLFYLFIASFANNSPADIGRPAIRIKCQRGFHRTSAMTGLLWALLTVPSFK